VVSRSRARACPVVASAGTAYGDAMAPHLRLATQESDSEPSDINVIVADDHAFVRRSLRILLEGEPGFRVIAEASDVPAAIRYVHGHAPHVLIMDLAMPNGSSLDAIRRLNTQAPGTEIVVLTMDDDPAFAQAALDAGAIGYVLKQHADAELPDAVRRAAAGERYVSSRLAMRLESMSSSRRDDDLTLRELEVLRLVALGHTSREIARRLHVSVRTVETHRRRLHRKLGLRTRAELVDYALRHGLLGPPSA
jgi:two-component system response regulator NreC